MQLLSITTTPMKYNLEIEPARLEKNQDFIPKGQYNIENTEVRLDSKRGELHIDTYEARKSLGFRKIGDMIAENAQKGMDSISQKIREYVTEGSEMARIEDGVTIAQIVRQKMMEQPQSYMVFLPSTGADFSWQPGYLNTDWTEPVSTADYQRLQCAFNYIPGSVRMEILEYAKVEIEYLGQPMYVPPSAAPGYEEPVAI